MAGSGSHEEFQHHTKFYFDNCEFCTLTMNMKKGLFGAFLAVSNASLKKHAGKLSSEQFGRSRVTFEKSMIIFQKWSSFDFSSSALQNI